MRKEKQLLLDATKEKLEKSKAVILLHYERFSPSVSWAFNSQVKKNQGCFEVVKKRIFLKAAEQCGISFNMGDYQGHMGVVFAFGDALEATKTIFEFGKANEGSLKVLYGKFEGAIYSDKDLEALSKLPGLETMRAQLLGLFEAPMSQTLAVMESLLTSVPYCLENKSKS